MKTLALLLCASLAFAQVPKAVPAPPQGRFQLVHLGTARADQYLLDTLLGRVWRAVETKTGDLVFTPIQFEDPVGGLINYPLPDEAVADYQRNLVTTRRQIIKESKQ